MTCMTLRDWRKVNKLTQAETGEFLGVTQMAVCRYERGERIPSQPVMQRIVELTDGQVQPNSFYQIPALAPQEAA